MKTTIIYHSADFDGLFCREIAKKFISAFTTDPSPTFIGWDWSDAKLAFPPEGIVYVLDLSPDCFESVPEDLFERLVWIDHHKSAIEKWDCKPWNGYRIDGVAACRLAWQYFANPNGNHQLPVKESYVVRNVSEPYAVRLAGEYDIWDKRDPNADIFQLGLRSQELSENDWNELLTTTPASTVLLNDLLRAGVMLQRYVDKRDASVCQACGYVAEFEGVKFLCLNSAGRGSMQFAAKDVPETGHDALLKYNFDGKQWDVSMYHAKHRTDLDLSKIAVKHGGGGHRGACGFRTAEIPFAPQRRRDAEEKKIAEAKADHRGAILDGQFLVIGSGESYNTEIVDGQHLLKCLLEMMFGTEEDAAPDEKKYWEETLDNPEQWHQDSDIGPTHFHEQIGETDRIDIYQVSPKRFILKA